MHVRFLSITSRRDPSALRQKCCILVSQTVYLTPILLRKSKSSNKFPPSNDEPKESSLIKRSILEWAFNHQFKFWGPFSPSDHPEHQIWGSVLPFRPPRASNLGGHFTLPTTPSIEFGGSFYPSDHPEHQIWGSFSPFRQLGSQIWGSFFDHRPVRHPNLGSFFDHRPVRHPNLGLILASPTCPGIKSGGQDQEEQEGRSQIFFLFQKLLPHHFPTNKKN